VIGHPQMEPNGSSLSPSKKRHEVLASSSTRPPGPSLPILPFHASIRFSSSSLTDLEVTIPNVNESPLPTVLTLKQQIRFLRPAETHNRRIRLILAGKVLNDNTPLKAVQSQHRRRPSIAPAPPSLKGKEKEVVIDRLWIHCSMGEQLTDEEFEEEEREKQIQSTLPLPVGFDRLRSAGFSDDDIASLRAQFQRFHGSRDEDEAVDVTAMEERWLDESIGLGGGTQSVGDGPSDSYEETLFGFLIGYFAVLLFRMDLILGIICTVLYLGT
jgi:DUF2407 ubiquitin-like domain/DUF2407 C-terminal domain